MYRPHAVPVFIFGPLGDSPLSPPRMEPLGSSVTEAARVLGAARHTLPRVLNGHAGISPEMVLLLEKADSSRGCCVRDAGDRSSPCSCLPSVVVVEVDVASVPVLNAKCHSPVSIRPEAALPPACTRRLDRKGRGKIPDGGGNQQPPPTSGRLSCYRGGASTGNPRRCNGRADRSRRGPSPGTRSSCRPAIPPPPDRLPPCCPPISCSGREPVQPGVSGSHPLSVPGPCLHPPTHTPG